MTKPYAGKVPSVFRRTVDPLPWYSCAGFDKFGAPIDIVWHPSWDNALRRANRLAVLARRRRAAVAPYLMAAGSGL